MSYGKDLHRPSECHLGPPSCARTSRRRRQQPQQRRRSSDKVDDGVDDGEEEEARFKVNYKVANIAKAHGAHGVLSTMISFASPSVVRGDASRVYTRARPPAVRRP